MVVPLNFQVENYKFFPNPELSKNCTQVRHKTSLRVRDHGGLAHLQASLSQQEVLHPLSFQHAFGLDLGIHQEGTPLH